MSALLDVVRDLIDVVETTRANIVGRPHKKLGSEWTLDHGRGIAERGELYWTSGEEILAVSARDAASGLILGRIPRRDLERVVTPGAMGTPGSLEVLCARVWAHQADAPLPPWPARERRSHAWTPPRGGARELLRRRVGAEAGASVAAADPDDAVLEVIARRAFGAVRAATDDPMPGIALGDRWRVRDVPGARRYEVGVDLDTRQVSLGHAGSAIALWHLGRFDPLVLSSLLSPHPESQDSPCALEVLIRRMDARERGNPLPSWRRSPDVDPMPATTGGPGVFRRRQREGR